MQKTRNQINNRAIETSGYDRNKSVAWAHSNLSDTLSFFQGKPALQSGLRSQLIIP